MREVSSVQVVGVMLLAALIFGVLALCSVLNRYELIATNGAPAAYRLDRWNGKVSICAATGCTDLHDYSLVSGSKGIPEGFDELKERK